MWILWAIPSAFANRIRGGMFGYYIRKVIPFWSTTLARISMTGFMLIPIWFQHPWWRCLIAWGLLYLGFIFGWKAWQYLEKIPNDIFSLGLRGLVLTAPVGIFLGDALLSLCGLSMGILYFLAKFIPQRRELDGSLTDNVTWGEYMFGAVLGLCIAMSVR
jgi:hypothetical protein